MFKHKVLTGVVFVLALALVTTAVGCSWFQLSTDDQKTALKDSTQAMADATTYKVTGTMQEKGKDKEYKITLVKDGDNVDLMIEGGDSALKMLTKDGYVFIGNKEQWLRYVDKNNETLGDFSKSFDSKNITKDFKEENIDDEKMVYEGTEKVDGTRCYKFTYTELGSDKESGTLWIIKKDNKVKKVASSSDKSEGEMVFEYDDVSITTPTDYTEVDVEKDYTKIFEVMGDFMEANPDFGG